MKKGWFKEVLRFGLVAFAESVGSKPSGYYGDPYVEPFDAECPRQDGSGSRQYGSAYMSWSMSEDKGGL